MLLWWGLKVKDRRMVLSCILNVLLPKWKKKIIRKRRERSSFIFLHGGLKGAREWKAYLVMRELWGWCVREEWRRWKLKNKEMKLSEQNSPFVFPFFSTLLLEKVRKRVPYESCIWNQKKWEGSNVDGDERKKNNLKLMPYVTFPMVQID